MKNAELSFFDDKEIIELNVQELSKVNGGGFAYDLAWTIRFGANRFFCGDAYAVIDAIHYYRPLM